jgi:hypothetical protein
MEFFFQIRNFFLAMLGGGGGSRVRVTWGSRPTSDTPRKEFEPPQKNTIFLGMANHRQSSAGLAEELEKFFHHLEKIKI